MIGFCVFIWIKRQSNSAEVPRLFGYTPTLVMSGSMLPTLQIYSVNLMKNVDISDIEVGDIIVYRNTSRRINIIHRVYEIDYNETYGIILKTKGDNNSSPDNVLITKDNFIGKIVLTLNWAAGVMSFIILPDNSGFDMSHVMILSFIFIVILFFLSMIIDYIIIRPIKRLILKIRVQSDKSDKSGGN